MAPCRPHHPLRAEPPALRGPCSHRSGSFPSDGLKRVLSHAGSFSARASPWEPEDLKVDVFGTGGMSHQLASGRAGLINPDFDRMFLDASDHDPEKLAVLTHEEYVREAGSESVELITWLVMRGALGPRIRRAYEAYHVPASNAAAGMVLFENPSR
ncbi:MULTISPECIES: hypothetical protein [unclassified Streptomyces]|uniref:DODA-type extradiol aromatic ring-opening family dioxygenase n=1 Tax=unclassified Streptomyces TaxID=2593676 RepID=UPI0036E4AE97